MSSPSSTPKTNGEKLLERILGKPIEVFSPGKPTQRDVLRFWCFVKFESPQDSRSLLKSVSTAVLNHWGNLQESFVLKPEDRVTRLVELLVGKAKDLMNFGSKNKALEDEETPQKVVSNIEKWILTQRTYFEKVFDIELRPKRVKLDHQDSTSSAHVVSFYVEKSREIVLVSFICYFTTFCFAKKTLVKFY